MYPSEQERLIFDALYEHNRVPVWFLDNQKAPLYGSYRGSVDTAPVWKELKRLLPARIPPAPCCRLFSTNENELFFYFVSKGGGRPCHVVCGPVLLRRVFTREETKRLSFSYLYDTPRLQEILYELPVLLPVDFLSFVRSVMLILHQDAPSLEELRKTHIPVSEHPDSGRELSFLLFSRQEEPQSRHSYRQELVLFHSIRDGDTSLLERLLPILEPNMGSHLSDNPKRQLLYECVCTTALAARFAMEGGLDEETAFALHDLYIRRFDHCGHSGELLELYRQMLRDFTDRTARAGETGHTFTRPVRKALRYISLHLHQPLTLPQIAAEAGLSPKYFSRLFRRETGITLTAFIRSKRIEEAKRLLLYGDLSCAEISQTLCFGSQSRFISIFKEETGVTPREYRTRHTAGGLTPEI